MTEQEQINSEVQMKLAMQDAKFNAFVEEMRDFKTELRDRDNQRAAEIQELRQRQDAAQAKHDADMKEMRQKHDADMADMNQRFYSKFDAMDAKIDRLGDKIQTLVITAVVGFGAILVAVISALK